MRPEQASDAVFVHALGRPRHLRHILLRAAFDFPPYVAGTDTTAQILPNAVRQDRENLIAGVVGW